MMKRQENHNGGKRFSIMARIKDPDHKTRVGVFEQLHRHRNRIWGDTLMILLHKPDTGGIPEIIHDFLYTTECLDTIAGCQKDQGKQIPSALSIHTAAEMFAGEAGRRFLPPAKSVEKKVKQAKKKPETKPKREMTWEEIEEYDRKHLSAEDKEFNAMIELGCELDPSDDEVDVESSDD